MNCLRIYFIYEYSSISITYYVTEILVYKFVIYEGLEFWLICLNEYVIDQEWVTWSKSIYTVHWHIECDNLIRVVGVVTLSGSILYN